MLRDRVTVAPYPPVLVTAGEGLHFDLGIESELNEENPS
jgi:hypothetical protein